MAKPKDADKKQLPRLTVGKEEAEKQIVDRTDKGKQLLEFHMLDENVASEFLLGSRFPRSKEELEKAQMEYSRWNSYNIALLRKLFDSPEIAEEYNQSLGFAIGSLEPTLDELVQEFRDDAQRQINRLESIKDRLQLYGEPAQPLSSKKASVTHTVSNKVFIVHGRDEATKQATARFLEKLELEPIILHEQPNKSRTIIEKFEDHSAVSFAVVLLTGDDMGRLAKNNELSLRARQNVIFEWGYFIGKLSRKYVCALYQNGVELPSDYDGVVRIHLDEENAWKISLARELKAAGFNIDLNKAI